MVAIESKWLRTIRRCLLLIAIVYYPISADQRVITYNIKITAGISMKFV
jgi:hypothetical protein